MGLLARLPKVGQLFSLLEHINLGELLEAIAAIEEVRRQASLLDVSSAESVGALVDASVNALRQSVDVTKTQADDEIVEFLAKPINEHKAILVAAIQWLAARPTASEGEFIAAMSAAHPNATKLSTILETALYFWSMIRPYLNRGS